MTGQNKTAYQNNYHYVHSDQGQQMLPLVSKHKSNGQPYRALGAHNATTTKTNVPICHGTSGSGVFLDGTYQFLGVADLGPHVTDANRLCDVMTNSSDTTEYMDYINNFYTMQFQGTPEVLNDRYFNAAVGKPIYASTNYDTQNYNAPKANDDNIFSGWSPTGADTGPYIYVDLGQAYRVKQVEVVTRQDWDQPETRRNFAILGYDANGNYVGELGEQGAQSLPFQSTYTLPISDPTRFRYILVGKTVSEYFFVSELRVVVFD